MLKTITGLQMKIATWQLLSIKGLDTCTFKKYENAFYL